MVPVRSNNTAMACPCPGQSRNSNYGDYIAISVDDPQTPDAETHLAAGAHPAAAHPAAAPPVAAHPAAAPPVAAEVIATTLARVNDVYARTLKSFLENGELNVQNQILQGKDRNPNTDPFRATDITAEDVEYIYANLSDASTMCEQAVVLLHKLCANTVTVDETQLMHILGEVAECERYALLLDSANEELIIENRKLAEKITALPHNQREPRGHRGPRGPRAHLHEPR